ncbi:MAG: archease [Methanomicrobiales archaeon]|nr:archease [Methanomicrobiales archaeon]
MPYEELPHTADIRVRVWAGSMEGLFAEAAVAMNRIMYAPCQGEGVSESVSLNAEDIEALLHDFLSEVLFLSEVRGVVFCSAEVRIEGGSLNAILRGEPFDRRRHGCGPEIKGISYYGLRIYKRDEDYVMEAIFDI